MNADVLVVIGADGIGQAIAHRQGSGKTVLLADLNKDPLTELPDVAAVQEAQPSLQPIAELSGRSRSPGRCSDSASLIATETGHTLPNQSANFSSLPIFDINRGGPLSIYAAVVSCNDSQPSNSACIVRRRHAGCRRHGATRRMGLRSRLSRSKTRGRGRRSDAA